MYAVPRGWNYKAPAWIPSKYWQVLQVEYLERIPSGPQSKPLVNQCKPLASHWGSDLPMRVLYSYLLFYLIFPQHCAFSTQFSSICFFSRGNYAYSSFSKKYTCKFTRNQAPVTNKHMNEYGKEIEWGTGQPSLHFLF